MIEKGQQLPDFELLNQDGKLIKSTDLKGKWVVLYVYPKDDTPGCTIEGQQFTGSKSEYDKINTLIFGISADGVDSHKDFCNKYAFTIDLLADTDAKLLKALGVEQSEYKGSFYWNRTTFIVDPQGKLAKVYDKVSPDGHSKQVLDDLALLTKQPVS
ncbi:MAG: peroxiredoxin [Candidatus Obscuribacterales bacterium]|nr:peroxiredoxin [Candidatus Obscuribacterales bacterium]